MDEKPPKTLFYPTRSALTKHNFFHRSKLKKIESEKIDCLHRPCSRPASRGKIESVRTHSEVIEQFNSFSLLKLLFLLKAGIAVHERLFLAKQHPKAEQKLRKQRFFDNQENGSGKQ